MWCYYKQFDIIRLHIEKLRLVSNNKRELGKNKYLYLLGAKNSWGKKRELSWKKEMSNFKYCQNISKAYNKTEYLNNQEIWILDCLISNYSNANKFYVMIKNLNLFLCIMVSHWINFIENPEKIGNVNRSTEDPDIDTVYMEIQ